MTDIAVDATHVYWVAGTVNLADGVVMKVPIAGGPPVMLASGQAQPIAVAVDATSVYWTNAGDVHGGSVVKLTPK